MTERDAFAAVDVLAGAFAGIADVDDERGVCMRRDNLNRRARLRVKGQPRRGGRAEQAPPLQTEPAVLVRMFRTGTCFESVIWAEGFLVVTQVGAGVEAGQAVLQEADDVIEADAAEAGGGFVFAAGLRR